MQIADPVKTEHQVRVFRVTQSQYHFATKAPTSRFEPRLPLRALMAYDVNFFKFQGQGKCPFAPSPSAASAHGSSGFVSELRVTYTHGHASISTALTRNSNQVNTVQWNAKDLDGIP